MSMRCEVSAYPRWMLAKKPVRLRTGYLLASEAKHHSVLRSPTICNVLSYPGLHHVPYHHVRGHFTSCVVSLDAAAVKKPTPPTTKYRCVFATAGQAKRYVPRQLPPADRSQRAFPARLGPLIST